MRDVRRHGQDVLLTMTIDPKVSDEHLRAIGQDLRTFGRVQLRINHEATVTGSPSTSVQAMRRCSILCTCQRDYP